MLSQAMEEALVTTVRGSKGKSGMPLTLPLWPLIYWLGLIVVRRSSLPSRRIRQLLGGQRKRRKLPALRRPLNCMRHVRCMMSMLPMGVLVRMLMMVPLVRQRWRGERASLASGGAVVRMSREYEPSVWRSSSAG